MDRKILFKSLRQIAVKYPELTGEIEGLALTLTAFEPELTDKILKDYLDIHPDLAVCFRNYLEDTRAKKQSAPERKPAGRVFPVHKPYSDEIRRKMDTAKKIEYHMKKLFLR